MSSENFTFRPSLLVTVVVQVLVALSQLIEGVALSGVQADTISIVRLKKSSRTEIFSVFNFTPWAKPLVHVAGKFPPIVKLLSG